MGTVAGSCYPYRQVDVLALPTRCKEKTTLVIRLLLSDAVFKVLGLNLYSLDHVNLESVCISLVEFGGGRKEQVDFVGNGISYYTRCLTIDLYRQQQCGPALLCPSISFSFWTLIALSALWVEAKYHKS